MSSMVLIFIGIVLFGLAVMSMNIYNGLISLRSQLERAWANIDVILKQRYDEIPQLIQVIEQYVNYEGGLLTKLADARKHYGAAQDIPGKIEAAKEMSVALKGVLAIGENYPDLKSNQNFSQLQMRISQLEDQLADRRETYNEAVANFNTRIDQFPDVLAARMLNYNRQIMFQVSDMEKSMPSLKMNLPKYGQGA